MKPRTRARSVALQALYEIDIANHLPADVFQQRLTESPLADDLAEFARQITFGVLPLTNELDLIIAKYAPEWPLDQIAAIDRNILRLACWELAVQGAGDPADAVRPFVDALLEQRVRAREARDWAAADAIRDRLLAAGVELHDTSEGTTWELHQTEPVG